MRLDSRIPTAAALVVALSLGPAAAQPGRQPASAVGTVFNDANANGVRDPGEKGLPGVRISNGRDVVRTDAGGRYRLPIDGDTIIFLIKPRGWMSPLGADNLPRFYYIHKPAGSPPLRCKGIDPTGPLPGSVDFPLRRHAEPTRFRAFFLADIHIGRQEDLNYYAHDLVEELAGGDAALAVSLGDLVGGDPSLFGDASRVTGLIGIPWYTAIGNHDLNDDAKTDELSDETFERYFGPTYYSFDYGPVHFLVLDNINWTADQDWGYTADFGPRQLEFVRNDLAAVPQNQLVVVAMHIPLFDIDDRGQLYRLLEKRPNVFTISGHHHTQQHRFIGRDNGWNGAKPLHHLVNVAACGSWWTGAPDEVGIPHATMPDGAPNGYSIITFDNSRYSVQFKAARRPADYQMNIYAPEEITAADSQRTEVFVNVFAGSARSKVEMRLGRSGSWSRMDKVEAADPYYLLLKKMEQGPNRPPGKELPSPSASQHLWKAVLPKNPPPGTYLIFVRTTDMFGRTYCARRAITIRPAVGPRPVRGSGRSIGDSLSSS
jgi:hypothetical protein